MNRMMNAIHQKTSIVYFLAVIYFFVALFGFNSFLLCVESDGCIVVESTLDGSNCNSPFVSPSQSSSCTPATMGEGEIHPHCNSCVDIPLFANFINKSVISFQDKIPLIKIQSIANHAFLSSVVTMTAAVYPSFQPSIIDCISPLSCIRTVRLLI